MYQCEDAFYLLVCKGFQLCADLCGTVLQVLDELLQIVDQVLLVCDELCGFHLLFRIGAVKFPQIVLVILAKPPKILLEFFPPFAHFLQRHLFQMLGLVQSLLNPAKCAGRKSCVLGGEVFQRDGHALDLQRLFCHHVLKLAVFEISNRIRLVGILNRRQILPFDQHVKIGHKVFRRIFGKNRILMQQGQNRILVQLVMHFLVFQIERPHNGPVG